MAKKKDDKIDYYALSKRVIEVIEEDRISVIKACDKVGIKTSTFHTIKKKHEDISDQYMRACKLRCWQMAEEIIELADAERETVEYKEGEDAIKGSYKESLRKDNINRTKTQIDARKWLLSKMMPERFGNKKEDKKDNKVTISFKEKK